MLNSTSVEVISDEQTALVLKVLMYGLIPAVSLFAVVGNVFSIVVLMRHGLRKCSNILLVSLAVADIHFLVSYNSVPKVLYEAVGGHRFVGFSPSDMNVLFVFFVIFTFYDYAFGLLGLTLPMLITIERLLMIFFPLNFHRILTPGRTWLAVAVLSVYYISMFIFASFLMELQYVTDNSTNETVGVIVHSKLFYENFHLISFLQDLLVYSSFIIPPIFTIIGCVIIFIKLKMTSMTRKRMTSATHRGSRTTRMLLAVCAAYTLTTSFQALPLYIPQYAVYSLTDQSSTNIGKILYQVINLASCVNSAINFIVYIVLNNKFRHTFLHLFCCSTRTSRQRFKHRSRQESSNRVRESSSRGYRS
ncbi:FMRFamide receptor-like [Physella acuta]|uniref:FMRFamide receptor-like n=1 Tax=Physella acuta TaxID=109671 RepID=UPI0027DBDAEE|nr:FMRFamide receptor-like [Physella acuta]